MVIRKTIRRKNIGATQNCARSEKARLRFSELLLRERFCGKHEGPGRVMMTEMKEITLTAIYEEAEEAEEGGYIGYVAELPGANTQGETLQETRENLVDAVNLILETNREEAERRLATTAKVTKERLVLRAA